MASSDSPYDEVNPLLEKAGVRAATSFQVPHFTAVPYIVGGTDLVVTVPRKLAQRAAAPFKLDYLRPPLRLPRCRRISSGTGAYPGRGQPVAAHFAGRNVRRIKRAVH